MTHSQDSNGSTTPSEKGVPPFFTDSVLLVAEQLKLAADVVRDTIRANRREVMTLFKDSGLGSGPGVEQHRRR